MSYMSYCMYEGTLYELKRCLSDVYEHINDEARYEVPEHEIDSFRLMVRRFHRFMCDTELINPETLEIDEEVLDDICFKMEQYNEEDEDEE